MINNPYDLSDEEIWGKEPTWEEQEIERLKEENNRLREKLEDVDSYVKFLIITTAGIQDELYSRCKLGMVAFKDTLWGKEILELIGDEK